MAKESLLLKNLLSSTSFTRDQRFSSLTEESKSGPFNLTSSFQSSFQGEMLRFKKSSKELTISRWCVLNENSFRYYKTKFSALCEEKPLLELPTSLITSVKALSSDSEFALEIFTGEENLPLSPLSSKFSMKSSASCKSSRHLLSRPRYLEPRPGKFTKPAVKTVIFPSPEKTIRKNSVGIRESKISWTTRENLMYLTEERLIFIVSQRNDWEKWQKAFSRFVKVEVLTN
jgi:hypothetical protein